VMSTVSVETTPAPAEYGERSSPCLAEGTELFGEYEGSAYQNAQYLVRRHDGQVIQLTRLLYLVASFLDGNRRLAEVAERVTEGFGRHVVADNVVYLVNNKLQPLGLVANTAEANTATLTRSTPLLGLRYRARVVPPRFHRAVTLALRPLFWPPVILVMLGSVIGLNVWLGLSYHRAFARSFTQVLAHPGLFLLVTGLLIFSGVFHETGHATAARYGGAQPGVMGVALYLIWPAFYTDLTDSYRLNRRGRLRTDLGGVYFNTILIVAAGGGYLVTNFAPLLVFITLSATTVLYQFLPFVRLDGYYIMSDLIGVPNLFAYVAPVLAGTFRRDPAAQNRLSNLNRRARRAIKIWAGLTVAFLLFNFGSVIVLAPILIPAETTQARRQVTNMLAAFAHSNVPSVLNDLVNLLFVVIAPLGMLLIAVLLLRRLAAAVRRWWHSRPLVAALVALVAMAAVLFQGQALVTHVAASLRPATVAAAARSVVPAVTPPVAVPPALVAPAAPALPATPAVPTAPNPGTATPAPAVAAPVTVVVQPHDTLWTLAGRYLGDPQKWPQLFALNQGRPQSDGRSLTDPHWIDPGWQLQLPAGATTPAAVASAAPPTTVSPTPVPPTVKGGN
jgi:putative peptide zinc metalloprotease protein